MTTEWFISDGTGVSIHAEDQRLILIGDDIPDWVKAPPETPEIGARTFKVHGVTDGPCIKCKQGTIQHLELEEGYRVAHCKACGFVWYRLRT